MGRSLMIIVTPLVILQVIAGYIFYESHWRKVSLTLSRSVAGDIAMIIDLMRVSESSRFEKIFNLPSNHLGMSVSYSDGEILSHVEVHESGKMENTLAKALHEALGRPFTINSKKIDRHIVIDVQLSNGVLQVIAARKRLFSSTTYIFVLWMVGSSLILLSVASIFMRNQVKPIRRLAEAADDFGKGRDAPRFKLEGAQEVRQAAAAFIDMRDRIKRQISQRTEMLAGVSHDLRTPLTRMKLQLELANENTTLCDLNEDVIEMENMLEGYLAFARGEGGEDPKLTNLGDLLNVVVSQARRKGGFVDLHIESNIDVMLRPEVFKRCLTNLIDNAIRYGEHVLVRSGKRGDFIEVIIDDDGPGIPKELHEDVFKPFYRIEGSRNIGTGGVGLGMTIASDILRVHGGDISLEDSPNGGLRVRLKVPL